MQQSVKKITVVAVKTPNALAIQAAASHVPVNLDTLGMDANAPVSHIVLQSKEIAPGQIYDVIFIYSHTFHFYSTMLSIAR